MSISSIDSNTATISSQIFSTQNNSNDFSVALSEEIATNNNLLTSFENSQAYKPDMKTFIDATGTDVGTASELLYGVIGSNTDTRNWQSIMSSSDPITMARKATAQLYGQSDPSIQSSTIDDQTTILDSNEHFSLLQHTNEKKEVDQESLMMTTSQGVYLRNAGTSTEQILHNAWLFGFDATSLSTFKDSAELLHDDALANALSTIPDESSTTSIKLTNGSETIQENAINNENTLIQSNHKDTNLDFLDINESISNITAVALEDTILEDLIVNT